VTQFDEHSLKNRKASLSDAFLQDLFRFLIRHMGYFR